MSAGKSNYGIDYCLVTAAALTEDSVLHRGEGFGLIPQVCPGDLLEISANPQWRKLHLATGINEDR